jgi:two-component system, NtrC family, response regulator PilR
MSKQIIGQSKELKSLLKLIDKIAPTPTSILIIGESGTGKELVARRIHEMSPRKKEAFVPVNCGAIPENLIESELFGHKRGSFTGAVADKEGLFETAHHGTLFLDEVGELPLLLQVKLLRAIQDRTIRRVGGNEDKKIDVRILAATNRNLEKDVQNGLFREDLYYRLNVILLETPPLRTRKDDIPALADFFLKKFNESSAYQIKGISDETMAVLRAYDWPGNIRELENSIQRMATLETEETLTLNGVPETLEAFLPSALKKAREAEVAPEVIELPDFSKGPVDLEAFLAEVRDRVTQRALAYAGGDAEKLEMILKSP